MSLWRDISNYNYNRHQTVWCWEGLSQTEKVYLVFPTARVERSFQTLLHGGQNPSKGFALKLCACRLRQKAALEPVNT